MSHVHIHRLEEAATTAAAAVAAATTTRTTIRLLTHPKSKPHSLEHLKKKYDIQNNMRGMKNNKQQQQQQCQRQRNRKRQQQKQKCLNKKHVQRV